MPLSLSLSLRFGDKEIRESYIYHMHLFLELNDPIYDGVADGQFTCFIGQHLNICVICVLDSLYVPLSCLYLVLLCIYVTPFGG